MGVQHRCSRSDCRARVTLSRDYDSYVRFPKCPGCGRKHTLKNVNAKEKERTQRRLCRCLGVPWPHRRGTILPDGGVCVHVTEDELFLREIGAVKIIPRGDEVPF